MTYDDSNWREEYKAFTSNKRELELLENGPDSLASSWYLMALKGKWKRIKGYKDPEPPDCQSSFKEWTCDETHFNQAAQARCSSRAAMMRPFAAGKG